MVCAKWNGTVVAESESIMDVEGNQYFPPEALDMQYFKESSHTSVCPWKGTAKYYNIEVGGKTNENAAWYYPDPKPAAKHIKGKVAFWKGVELGTRGEMQSSFR